MSHRDRRGPTTLVSLFAVLLAAGGSSGQEPGAVAATNPLGFLEPLIGTWVQDAAWLAEHPGMEGLVPLSLDWGPARLSVSYRAGLPSEDGEVFTAGTIVWNPHTERAEFVSSQSHNGLSFAGYYEPLADGSVRRTYDVYYPHQDPVPFRETFFFVAPDTVDWLTEWKPDGRDEAWVPRRGTGDPESRVVRAPDAPADALQGFARIIGSWMPDVERMPAEMVEWRERNRVTNGATVFEWGTGSLWIEFTERREQDGNWFVEGSGLFAFDPHRRVVTYVEHTSSGITLRGTLVARDGTTIERHYRSHAPDGTQADWVDTWRWEDPADACFEWTTARVTSSGNEPWPPYWVCRDEP